MAKNDKKSAKTKAAKPVLKKAPLTPIKGKAAPEPQSAPAKKSEKSSPPMEKPSKKNALRDSILKRKAATKPIAFSLDEVRAIAKTVTSKTNVPFITKTTKSPVIRNDMTAPGPADLITTLLPTKSPAPITPPSAIIVI